MKRAKIRVSTVSIFLALNICVKQCFRHLADLVVTVRNRASEVAGLLGDVDRIRQERRKAKGNRSKYQGQGNDGGMSFVTAGGSRYGGFGSDSVGGGGGGYDGGDGWYFKQLGVG